MKYRSFTKQDKEKCLEIFRSNTPDFFGMNEEPEFADFLERMPCPYYVLEAGDELIGCGGFFINDENRSATLCWGMVDRRFHKQSYGKYLLLERLNEIAESPQAEKILLDTSQYSKGFFEKLGFVVNKVTQDGYFQGLHRHDMELILDDTKRILIANELTSLEKRLS